MDPAEKVELEALEHVKPIDEASAPGDSDIQQFYCGATVFITGGTGFIGKQLIEKLFRSCEIEKAFVLIRPKKGKLTKERLQDMLNDSVFGPVRKKKPDLESRLVCVEGDVADVQLGICDSDWNMIAEEANIIFHAAATVHLEEKIGTATLINVRGTREALKLAKACKKLRSFVYVSTTYCQATPSNVKLNVKEQFYKSPIPPETMLTLVETVDSKRLDFITNSLISDWPNTYTFTKAIAEELVQSEAGNLPLCIVRPSLVLNTYHEPVPGWLDSSCSYGATAVPLGIALGFLRVIYVDNRIKLSIVPVDFVNNATIAAAWETAIRRTKVTRIYNLSSTNCVTFAYLMKFLLSFKTYMATPRAIWYCFLVQTDNRLLYWFLSWILHYIPAYCMDTLIKVFHLKKPEGLKSFVHTYSKFKRLALIYEFFLINEWDFDNTNLRSLWQKLSTTDKTIYNFDMQSIDWNYYLHMWWLGTRKYLIKDGLKDTSKSVARQKWLKLANYIVLAVYLFVFWKMLCWIWYTFVF